MTDPTGARGRDATRLVRAVALAGMTLSGVLLIAPGVSLLGLWLVLSGFRGFAAGIRFGPPRPPSPTDLANDARNAAELAGMLRQSLVLIGSGGAGVALGAVIARGARAPSSRDRPAGA